MQRAYEVLRRDDATLVELRRRRLLFTPGSNELLPRTAATPVPVACVATVGRRPLVVAIPIELKPRIGKLLAACPPDLRAIGSIDFIALDRSDDEYWQLGVSKILRTAPVLLGEGGGHKFSPTPPGSVPW